MADGSIRIETKIDNSNLDGDISELKNISDEAAKSIESNSKNLEQTINKANRELEKTQNELREIEAEIAKFRHQQIEIWNSLPQMIRPQHCLRWKRCRRRICAESRKN